MSILFLRERVLYNIETRLLNQNQHILKASTIRHSDMQALPVVISKGKEFICFSLDSFSMKEAIKQRNLQVHQTKPDSTDIPEKLVGGNK